MEIGLPQRAQPCLLLLQNLRKVYTTASAAMPVGSFRSLATAGSAMTVQRSALTLGLICALPALTASATSLGASGSITGQVPAAMSCPTPVVQPLSAFCN